MLLKFPVLLTYGVRGLPGKAAVLLLLLAGPLSAQPVTILAFGDSLIQGYGLVQDKGFVPQLQRWLDAQGAEARVINGGESGSTTAGGAARIDWALTPEIDAIIVELGGNDLLRGIDPAQTRANLETILGAAHREGVEILLTGIDAPGNYGAEYKRAFDAIFPELAREFDAAYYPDFFAGLRAGAEMDRAAHFQSDGIHPNAEGVALIVRDIGPTVLDLVAAARAGQQ